MSCQECYLSSEDMYGKTIFPIITSKIKEKSKVRILYADLNPVNLLIDNVETPEPEIDSSYFHISSSEKILKLVNNSGKEIISDIFLFKPKVNYSIILVQNHILQFEEENMICPFPGYARFQIYNLDCGNLNVMVNSKKTFENLGNDTLQETIVKIGVYEVSWLENGEKIVCDLEFRNSNIYTLFLVGNLIFLVENEYCINSV